MANPRRAFVFKRGETWCVGWRERDGKQRRKAFGSKKTDATNYAKIKSGELIQGISDGFNVKAWGAFVADFRSGKTAALRPNSQDAYDIAIQHFERICKPKNISDVTSAMVSKYASTRINERGKKVDSKTSPATVNKELRCLKRIFRVAADWKLLKDVPRIEFAKEPQVGITFISPEEFSLLYGACDAATKPNLENISTAAWWRAFLIFTYMTGWRVSEPLKLLREDLDLVAGVAITRAGDNKGGKESRVPLHPIVVAHLEAIAGKCLEVFPWPHDTQQLWPQLRLIQSKSGIKKVCRKDHKHNAACERFGFHDLRRGFATANAGNLSASQLQVLMRHSSYTTTQLYIDMAKQVGRDDVVSKLSVPLLPLTSHNDVASE